MNQFKEDEKLQAFWDEASKGLEPIAVKQEDTDCSDTLSKYMKLMGDSCPKVLDIGVGLGDTLCSAKILGKKMSYGLGIDTSPNSIEFARKSALKSSLTGLDFKVGGHEVLASMEDGSFDGIICSNVLDVVSPQTSDVLVTDIKRLLRNGGLFFLKVNFFLDEEMISRTKAVNLGQGCYSIDGVLRSFNQESEYWIKKMEPLSLIKQDYYARVPNGPKDRIFLFRK